MAGCVVWTEHLPKISLATKYAQRRNLFETEVFSLALKANICNLGCVVVYINKPIDSLSFTILDLGTLPHKCNTEVGGQRLINLQSLSRLDQISCDFHSLDITCPVSSHYLSTMNLLHNCRLLLLQSSISHSFTEQNYSLYPR
jgi:hypothetical protein